MAEALQLQQDMRDFNQSFDTEIAGVLQRTPLTVRPRKVKVDLDARESDSCEANLPSPLQPLPVGGAPPPATDVGASSPPPPSLPSPLKPQLLSGEAMPAMTVCDVGSIPASERGVATAPSESVDSTGGRRGPSGTEEGAEERMEVVEGSSGVAAADDNHRPPMEE